MYGHRGHLLRRHRGTRALASLALIGLVAAACGDDDGESDTGDESSDATASAAATDELHDDDHDDGNDAEDHDEEAAVAADAEAAGAVEQDGPHPRLLLGDGETGGIEVLDLISGEMVDVVETDGFGALHVADRFVLAVDSDNDLLTVVDGGSWTVSHGDHGHSYTSDPVVVGTTTGANPIHVVNHDDQIAVFFDDDGTAGLFTLDDLASGDVVATGEVTTSDPHHGVVVPIDGHYIVSVPAPNPEDLPTGVEVRHGTDDVEASFDDACPELHGETATDDGVLFACEEGLLWVSGLHEEWTADAIPYPEHDGDDEVRVGSFVHEHGVAVVAGQFDDHSVAIVDTAADPVPEIVLAELEDEVRALAIADGGASIVALTTDGSMHLIDTATGEAQVSAEVLDEDPLPDDAEWWEPRRRIVVDGERAYVSDPEAGSVTEVAINDEFRVTRTFEPEIVPELVALVGNSH